MIPVSVNIDAFLHYLLSSSLNTTQSLNTMYIPLTPNVCFSGILLDIVFDQYVSRGMGKGTAAKN